MNGETTIVHNEVHNKDDLLLIEELIEENERLKSENSDLKQINEMLEDELRWYPR